MLKATPACHRRKQVVLHRPVCQQAFRKLIGIGSKRYVRLRSAASKGVTPPIDGRSAPQRKLFRNPKVAGRRAMITEFLEELYQTLSEPMPDANQSTAAVKRKADGHTEAGDLLTEGKLRFRRHRGRRPRLAAQMNRGCDKSKMKLLPPGSYSDYLGLLQLRHPGTKISLKLFSKESQRIIIRSGYIF